MPLGTSPVITVLAISAPFAAPWFIVAPSLGVFRYNTLARPKRMLLATTVAWLIAGSVGLLVRAAILQRAIVLPFAVTALTIVGALLLVWHGLLSIVLSRRIGQPAHDG